MTNIAVKVDGKRPIGARACRISEPHLLLVSYTGGRESGVSTETVCSSLEDLKDYCQPHAPGRRQSLSKTLGFSEHNILNYAGYSHLPPHFRVESCTFYCIALI